jgi:feruloyl esterase
MLPARCRIAATLTPSADSDIKMELWLPAEDWYGKFEAVGGGGWAGQISFAAMVTALQEHYATASTDTGHAGGNANFALGHPEKIVDFGYRAIHEMTVKSKDIIKAYYGRAPRLSYFNGCSTGGRQALMEAQRYPEDFDGIVAGAPANNHLHLHAASVARAIDLINIQGDRVLSEAKLRFFAKSVMDACDALDGVKDGLLQDPRKCKFDPSTLLCRGADSDTCLTQPQLEAVKRMYADTRTSKGEIVWTGFAPGSELGWNALRTANNNGPGAGAFDSIRILGYQDMSFDWHNFNLDRDLALAVEKAGYINAGNPDLSGFKSRGGKLILYHGWNDAGIAPGNTINYYSSVLGKMGRNQDNWMRLYMIPGMEHCRGGPGPDQFNVLVAIERWRESNEAPGQIVAAHVANGRVDRTRPLCPYPQVAVYKGTGSINDAASFSCKAP